MVMHDKIGLSKPLPFSRSGLETGGQEILSVLGGGFGARIPQQLRASLPRAGTGGPGGSYSLEITKFIVTPGDELDNVH